MTFFFFARELVFLHLLHSAVSHSLPLPLPPCATQACECEHVSSAPRGSAHNAYRSDLNSVTTDNFTNSWGSIKAHSKYATCHFYIRRHAVQNGTLSLVFVIILQAKLVSLWGLKCQMIYPHHHHPQSLLHKTTSTLQSWVEEKGVRFTFKLFLSLGRLSTRRG